MSMPKFEIRYDRPKGNFGPSKNKEINDAVEDFFERVRAAAPAAWAASNVPEATGKLSSEAFGIGRIRKSRSPAGTSFSLPMGVNRVKTSKPKWAGSVGESYYPKFVQEGTLNVAPIRGTNMPVRDKQRNIVKGYKKDKSGKLLNRDKRGKFKSKQNLFVQEVKGQSPNPYMDRFSRNMNVAVRGAKGGLTRRIGSIIKK